MNTELDSRLSFKGPIIIDIHRFLNEVCSSTNLPLAKWMVYQKLSEWFRIEFLEGYNNIPNKTFRASKIITIISMLQIEITVCDQALLKYNEPNKSFILLQKDACERFAALLQAMFWDTNKSRYKLLLGYTP